MTVAIRPRSQGDYKQPIKKNQHLTLMAKFVEVVILLTALCSKPVIACNLGNFCCVQTRNLYNLELRLFITGSYRLFHI